MYEEKHLINTKLLSLVDKLEIINIIKISKTIVNTDRKVCLTFIDNTVPCFLNFATYFTLPKIRIHKSGSKYR